MKILSILCLFLIIFTYFSNLTLSFAARPDPKTEEYIPLRNPDDPAFNDLMQKMWNREKAGGEPINEPLMDAYRICLKLRKQLPVKWIKDENEENMERNKKEKQEEQRNKMRTKVPRAYW
jgi:hypothetical protein